MASSPGIDTNDTDTGLDKMADSLQAEVAERYNMSVQDYFSKLARSAVSLGPLRGPDKSNDSREGVGEGELEISDGVAWTLVAPLILLSVLVLAGAAVACLWRLKDRRGNRGLDTGPAREDQGPDGIMPEDTELHRGQDLHPSLQGLHGPAAAADGGPPGYLHRGHGPLHRLDPTARFRHSAEGSAYASLHQRHLRFSTDRGIQDKEGIHLQDNAKLEILVAGSVPNMVKSVSGQGGSSQVIHKASVESLAHLFGAGDLPKDLYCTVCQCYMAHRYQGNLFHPGGPPQLHPPHNTHQHHQSHQLLHSSGVHHHNHGVYDKLPCQQCVVSQDFRHHHHHQLACHEGGLHPPREKGHRRRISQSMDDHLHLTPHYQPPHPAAFRPLTELQDTVYQRLLQHVHNPPVYDLTNPDLSASSNTKGSSGHRMENPLFSADADDEEPSSSVSGRRDSPVGNGGSMEEERGRGRRDVPRIINSTSMMSNFGNSDPTHSGEDRHARRHSVHGKSVVGGPDVSSIQRISSASQAWHRTSCRLLPSTILSSPHTHSHNTTTTNTTTTDDDDDGNDDEGADDGQGETLSLPSSISRFHASRVQFPPLMPDAQYPLTSTKAFYSPSWPGQSSRGDGHPSSGHDNILEALENFSDNTSMQPNVGSSVTSGQVSDLRESQMVSSSVGSEPWGAPVDIRAPPSSPARLSENQEDPTNEAGQQGERHEEYGGDAGKEEQVRESAHREIYQDQMYDEGASGNPNGLQVEDQRNGEIPADVSSPGSKPRSVYRKSESSSAHAPKSASELHRARVLKGRKRKEQGRSDHKHGFFLIPKQDAKNGIDAHPYDQSEVNVGSAGKNTQGADSPGYVASPSRRQVIGRPPAHRKAGVSMVQENPEPPAATWDSRTSSRAEYSTISGSQGTYSSVKPSNGQRRRFPHEPHPQKLFSCKPSEIRAAQSHSSRTPSGLYVSSGKAGNITDSTDPNVLSSGPRFNLTYPIPERLALKASVMSASFPNVSYEPAVDVSSRPTAATLENRSSAGSRGKLKRTKSQEDNAYNNMGSSFDRLLQKGRSQSAPSSSAGSGQIAASVFSSIQHTSESEQKMFPPRAGQQFTQSRAERPKDQPGWSGTKTESQILAEILSCFPQDSLSSSNSASVRPDSRSGSRQEMSTVYNDVTIPTAFADELFGIWSLSPEMDKNSQPRTPLMTPLKEEAKRANRKFIWGNSGSPSGSTSTSSFAAGWPSQDDVSLGDLKRRNVSPQSRVNDDFGDYVPMDKTGGSSDQPQSTSAQMSISDSPSAETVPPPTPTVEDASGNAVLDNANDPSTTDEYKGLPLNNLNVSHLYVISGFPDNVNNNAVTSDFVEAGIGNAVSKVTSPAQPNTAATSATIVSADIQNRNSPTTALAVLEKQKHWL